MEPIEQPTFDPLPALDRDVVDAADRAELIEAEKKRKRVRNGESPSRENSPLHQPDGPRSNTSVLCSPQNYGLRVIIVSSVVFALAVTVALILTIYLEPKQIHGHASVVSNDMRCSTIGLDILKDGGNAVDASVASAFCLAVVSPHMCGIGGGGFAIVHDHKFTTSYTYNFQGMAPAGMTAASLEQSNIQMNVASASVPGFVKGLAALHKAHGVLPWKDLVQHSIELAQDGFKVSKHLADAFRLFEVEDFQLSALTMFLEPGLTEFKGENDTVTMTSLATSLKHISADPDALYYGTLVKTFVDEMKTKGSNLTEADLKSYKVLTPTVLKSKLKDLTVISVPAPAGGTLLGLILNMVQKFGWTKKTHWNDSMTYHQIIETFKFAFAQESQLGDPTFDPSVTEEEKYLLTDALASNLSSMVDNSTHKDVSHYGPAQPLMNTSRSGGLHLSVVDSSELMVSMTLSMNTLFGNMIALPKTGILLNSDLATFSPPNTKSANQSRNTFGPHKRPQSSMTPVIIYNQVHPCDRRLIIGGVSGAKGLTAMAETIISNLLFKQTLPTAVKAPRLYPQLFPMRVYYEEGIADSTIKALTQMGHDLQPATQEMMGVVCGIEKSNDDLVAATDPRYPGSVKKY